MDNGEAEADRRIKKDRTFRSPQRLPVLQMEMIVIEVKRRKSERKMSRE